MDIYYYDPFSIFPLIKPNLDTKLPLTNLHWKFNNQLKSIPKLPVNFVEKIPRHTTNDTSNKRKNSTATSARTSLARSSVDINTDIHLMFIQAKDLDYYRTQARPLIREWLKVIDPAFVHGASTVDSETPVNWFIVYYSPYKKDKIFKTSIYEKLKIDFVHGFKLMETNDNELGKLEIYNDFIVQLKSLILSSFTRGFIELESQLNREATLIKHHLTTENQEKPGNTAIKLMIVKSEILTKMYLFKEALITLNEASSMIDYITEIKGLESVIQLDKDLPVDEKLKLKYGMFLKQYDLTMLLIENETLASIKAIHLCNLFQSLIALLSEFLTSNPTNPIKVLISNIRITEHYLGLDIIEDIMQSDIDLSSICEFRGELRLFQRLNVVKLAHYLGYSIDHLTDIPLEVVGDGHISEAAKELDILANQDAFYKYFQKTTELVIKDFLSCDRTKTIDMLSIDLAFLNYSTKNYIECLNILQDSYQFYIDRGWNYMGNVLLEIYIDCLEQVKGRSEILVNSYIKLLTNFNLSHNKVDLNRLKCNTDIFKVDLNVDVVLDNQVFGIDLIPTINTEDGVYYMTVKLHNIFNSTKFDIVVLELNGVDFKSTDCSIESGINELKLYSNKFVLGTFRPIKLIVTTGKLQLVHSFGDSDDKIHFHQFPENFNATVEFNPYFTLGRPELLFNFDSPIEDLQILNAKNFTYDPFSYKSVETPTETSFILPISTSDKIITVKFKVIHGKNIYISESQLDTTLLLSVSVHDTFKSDSIFSRFQITPVATPVRILSVNLVSKGGYKVQKPLILPSAIIDRDQTYSSFYKVTLPEKSDHINNDFRLEIEYSPIQAECVTELAEKVENKLVFNHFLAPKLKFDYEKYYNGTLTVVNMEEIKNFGLGLPETIEISNETFKEKAVKKLIIEVPVPRVDVLQIIEYHYDKKSEYIVGEPIDVEIEIQSSTKWAIAPKQSADVSFLAESSLIHEPEQFIVGLLNDDNWLISGFKRKSFTVDLNNPKPCNKFKLVLIPLTVGKVFFPKLNIKFDNKDLQIDSLVKNGAESLLVVPELDTITFSF